MTTNDNIQHISFDNKDNSLSNLYPKRNFYSFLLLDPMYYTDFYEIIPKRFTISTNTGSFNFNTEMLKDTSTVISEYISKFPDSRHFHLHIDDKLNILKKIEQLYQGHNVCFSVSERKDFNLIINKLKFDKIPAFNKQKHKIHRHPVGIRYEIIKITTPIFSHEIVITKKSFYNFISNKNFETFSIATKKHEYKCNSFGILCSNVIFDFLSKEPENDCYNYDFDDDFSDFQNICDFFNFKMVDIESKNIQTFKKIAEDLQISVILDHIKDHDFLRKTADDQQLNTDSIENLFYHLYHIKELTLEKVKLYIIESEWSRTIEKVQELMAIILQVVRSDFYLHQIITDLLIELDEEGKDDSNKLSILLPFLIKKLMNTFGSDCHYSNFIYKLNQKGQIPTKIIIDKLHCICINQNSHSRLVQLRNVFKFFWPEILQINKEIVHSFMNNLYYFEIPFFKSHVPETIEKYKEMLDSGEPPDKLTNIIQKDDVDSLSFYLSYLIDEKISIYQRAIPYNIYEDFYRIGYVSYLDYAALYGSVKCFKYLLLNHFPVDLKTYKCAVNGGNVEIIRIVDQKIHENKINFDDFDFNIVQSIKNHRNDLFYWILEERIKNQIQNTDLLHKLAKNSIQNGNLYSFFELINKGYNLFDYPEIIEYSNENGYYTFSEIILKILSRKQMLKFSEKVSRTFVSFGSLSIFKLFINYMDQKDFSICFKCAVEFCYKDIIEFIFENLVIKKFELSIGIIEGVLAISAEKNEYELFNYIINEFLKVNPLFYNEVSWVNKILPNACKSKTIENVNKIVEFILKTDSKEKDITLSFMNAAVFGSLDILEFLANTSFIINYEQLSKSEDKMSSITEEVFLFIINKSPEKLKDAFLANFIYESIKNKNLELTECILKQNCEFDMSLYEAVKTNYLEMVNLVLKYNSNSNVTNKIYISTTPLYEAVYMNNISIVQRLLSVESLDMNLTSKDFPSPAKLAFNRCNPQIVKLFVDKGNPEAMYLYGKLIEDGKYIKADKEEAIKYYKMSAELGNADGMISCGTYLSKNKKNYEEAAKYFKMAADKNHLDGLFLYANVLNKGLGVEANKEKSRMYMKLAADQYHIDAANCYGVCLHHGDGVPVNNKEAIKYFKIAADQYSPIGYRNYAYMLFNGYGVEANKKEAIKYYESSKNRGCTKGMIELGNIFLKGDGVPVNKEIAVRSFHYAASNNDPVGMLKYGSVLYNGDGVPVDKAAALDLYRKAIETENPEALNEYGIMLENGIGIDSNKEEAIKFYKMAADKENPSALNNYGWILLKKEDYEGAFKCFKKAADLNNSMALFNLGFMLENGFGVQIDNEEANKCFKKAIEIEGVKNAFILAEKLEKENGIYKNEEKSARFYKMAADEGNKEAMFKYAKMLEDGRGIPQNIEESMKYYKLLADDGHDEAAISYQRLCNK